MRIFRFCCFLLLDCLLVSVERESKAQGTFSAITPNLQAGGVYFPGYMFSGGVGWTFTPTVDLIVVAISSTAPQVSFWNGTNQILASFGYSNTAGSLEPIAPMLLLAGRNYAISTQHPDYASSITFAIGSPTGADGIAAVVISPYLTGFGSFALSSTAQWRLYPATDNADYAFLGPNFQFQVVPEPSSLGLSILGLLFCARKLQPRPYAPSALYWS